MEGEENEQNICDFDRSTIFYCHTIMGAASRSRCFRDGKEWLQPSYFTGLSWDDVALVCPAGACAGTLNGIDVTGFTWASVDDVVSLLNNGYGVTPPVAATFNTSSIEAGSVWAPAFLADFANTRSFSTGTGITALTSNGGDITQAGALALTDRTDPTSDDTTGANSGTSRTLRSVSFGAIFFRLPTTATPVPTINVYGLILTTLGLLLVATRRLRVSTKGNYPEGPAP